MLTLIQFKILYTQLSVSAAKSKMKAYQCFSGSGLRRQMFFEFSDFPPLAVIPPILHTHPSPTMIPSADAWPLRAALQPQHSARGGKAFFIHPKFLSQNPVNEAVQIYCFRSTLNLTNLFSVNIGPL